MGQSDWVIIAFGGCSEFSYLFLVGTISLLFILCRCWIEQCSQKREIPE